MFLCICPVSEVTSNPLPRYLGVVTFGASGLKNPPTGSSVSVRDRQCRIRHSGKFGTVITQWQREAAK